MWVDNKHGFVITSSSWQCIFQYSCFIKTSAIKVKHKVYANWLQGKQLNKQNTDKYVIVKLALVWIWYSVESDTVGNAGFVLKPLSQRYYCSPLCCRLWVDLMSAYQFDSLPSMMSEHTVVFLCHGQIHGSLSRSNILLVFQSRHAFTLTCSSQVHTFK